MNVGVDSLGRGLDALARAQAAMRAIHDTKIGWLGSGTAKVERLRSEAVSQAREAIALLGQPTLFGRSWNGADQLEQVATLPARRGEAALHSAAFNAANNSTRAHLDGAALRARAGEAARSSAAWSDPEALRSALGSLAAAPVADFVQQQVRAAQLGALLESPALRQLAPKLPSEWRVPAPQGRATTAAPPDIATAAMRDDAYGRSEYYRALQRIAANAARGVWQSEDAVRAAVRAAVEPGAHPKVIDAHHEVLGVLGVDHERSVLGIDLAYRRGSDSDYRGDHAAVAAIRLAVAGAARDAAKVDAEVLDLLVRSRHASLTGPERDQLSARLFAFGAWERLGLDAHTVTASGQELPGRAWSAEILARPEWTNPDWDDGLGMDTDDLIGIWREHLHVKDLDDTALRADVLARLEDDSPQGREALGLAMTETEAAARLGLATELPGGLSPEAARWATAAFIGHWREQLRPSADPLSDVRALVARGAAITDREFARIAALADLRARDLGVELPLQLVDAQSARQVAAMSTPDARGQAARYLRAWQARLDGATFDQRALEAAFGDVRAGVAAGDVPRTRAAVEQVQLHAADLPGSPERIASWPLANGRSPLSALRETLASAPDPDSASASSAQHPDWWLQGAARHVDALERRLTMTPAQVDDLLARQRALFTHERVTDPSDRDRLLDVVFDQAAGARVGMEVPPMRRSPVLALTAPELDDWRAVAAFVASAPDQPTIVRELRDRAATGAVDNQGRAWLHTLLAGADESSLPPALTGTARSELLGLLAPASRGYSFAWHGFDVARAAARIVDAFDPPKAMDQQTARSTLAKLLLQLDPSSSPDGRARAWHEAIARGRLAEALPELTDADRASFDELLRSPYVALREREVVEWAYRLDPAATRAVLDHVDAGDPRAALDRYGALLGVLAARGEPLATARQIELLSKVGTSTIASTEQWLTDAIPLLERDGTRGALGRELQQRVLDLARRNLARARGELDHDPNNGYLDHPDYAEVGQVRSIVAMLAEHAKLTAAQQADEGSFVL